MLRVQVNWKVCVCVCLRTGSGSSPMITHTHTKQQFINTHRLTGVCVPGGLFSSAGTPWQSASVFASFPPSSARPRGLFCSLLPRGGGLSSGDDPSDVPPSTSRAWSFCRELCRQKQNMPDTLVQRLTRFQAQCVCVCLCVWGECRAVRHCYNERLQILARSLIRHMWKHRAGA